MITIARSEPGLSLATVRLGALGAPVGRHGVDVATCESEGPAYRIGMKPLRIEVLTKISGVSFDEATTDRHVTTADRASRKADQSRRACPRRQLL